MHCVVVRLHLHLHSVVDISSMLYTKDTALYPNALCIGTPTPRCCKWMPFVQNKLCRFRHHNVQASKPAHITSKPNF